MLILAGLGNPGEKYAGNRHNVGFMAVDAIARRWKFDAERANFMSLVSRGLVDTPEGGVRCLVLKPQTYMNESGRAVADALRFFKLTPRDVVVFYDELDMAPGRFRMKDGGGAAGHNGIRSLIQHIGPDFRRARIGIGHPGDRDRVLGHVLSDFAKSEHEWVDTLCGALADAAPLVVEGHDERYQAEVMRLAPAEKLDPRKAAREADG
jgi:PTH1 family peptidyl-tRNA hydrolase